MEASWSTDLTVLLERLSKLKSEFLTRISHQFRTALVGIQGFTEMIRDSEQLDLVEVKAFASDIYIDAELLDRAFKDMIELDGMEAGRTTLHKSRANLNELISSAVQTARDENHRLVRPRAHHAGSRHPAPQRHQVLAGAK